MLKTKEIDKYIVYELTHRQRLDYIKLGDNLDAVYTFILLNAVKNQDGTPAFREAKELDELPTSLVDEIAKTVNSLSGFVEKKS